MQAAAADSMPNKKWVSSSHAECIYVHNAGQQAKGATAYVTLEPCNHYGKTPPCSQALVDAQVAKVSLEALVAVYCSAFFSSTQVPNFAPPLPPLGAFSLQTEQT